MERVAFFAVSLFLRFFEPVLFGNEGFIGVVVALDRGAVEVRIMVIGAIFERH